MMEAPFDEQPGLVNFRDSSTVEEMIIVKQKVSNKSRKHENKLESCKDLINKRLKNSGETYSEINGRLIRKKTAPETVSTCACNLQCSDFDLETLQKHFFNFYNLDYDEQSAFLSSLMKWDEVKRRRVATDTSRRNVTVEYYLPLNDKTKLRVCKQMLCHTFQVTQRRLQILLEKLKAGKTLSDQRGHYYRPQAKKKKTLTYKRVPGTPQFFPQDFKCNCPLQCSKIKVETIQQHFSNFYSMNRGEQSAFLYSLIELREVRRRTVSADASRRGITVVYFLPMQEEKKMRVCKEMICHTFQLTKPKLRALIEKLKADMIWSNKHSRHDDRSFGIADVADIEKTVESFEEHTIFKEEPDCFVTPVEFSETALKKNIYSSDDNNWPSEIKDIEEETAMMHMEASPVEESFDEHFIMKEYEPASSVKLAGTLEISPKHECLQTEPQSEPYAQNSCCACPLQCFRINLETIQQLYSNFISLDHDEQSAYLSSLIDLKGVKRNVKAPVALRRGITLEYYLPMHDGTKERVCKQMFYHTFKVTERRLRTLANKIKANIYSSDNNNLSSEITNTEDETETKPTENSPSMESFDGQFIIKENEPDISMALADPLEISTKYECLQTKPQSVTYAQNSHCACPLQCSKIKLELIQQNFCHFNCMAYNEQSAFLCSLIELKAVRRRRPTLEASRRNMTIDYFLPMHDGTKERVCKQTFSHTFQVTEARLRTLVKKLKAGMSLTDQRGRYDRLQKIKNAENTSVLENMDIFSAAEYDDDNSSPSKPNNLHTEPKAQFAFRTKNLFSKRRYLKLFGSLESFRSLANNNTATL